MPVQHSVSNCPPPQPLRSPPSPHSSPLQGYHPLLQPCPPTSAHEDLEGFAKASHVLAEGVGLKGGEQEAHIQPPGRLVAVVRAAGCWAHVVQGRGGTADWQSLLEDRPPLFTKHVTNSVSTSVHYTTPFPAWPGGTRQYIYRSKQGPPSPLGLEVLLQGLPGPDHHLQSLVAAAGGCVTASR